jgi:hypothetical protein
MFRSLCALIMVVQLIIIIFLIFQAHDSAYKYVELRERNHDKMAKAARLLIQSATQTHPLIAYNHAIRGKFLLDDIVYTFGSVRMAEQQLKIPTHKLQKLVTQMDKQFHDLQDFMMHQIIIQFPQFDVAFNETAEFTHSQSITQTKPHKISRYT